MVKHFANDNCTEYITKSPAHSLSHQGLLKNLSVTSQENPRLGVGVLKFSGTIVYGRTRAFQKC